jgi:hypothetical protein
MLREEDLGIRWTRGGRGGRRGREAKAPSLAATTWEPWGSTWGQSATRGFLDVKSVVASGAARVAYFEERSPSASDRLATLHAAPPPSSRCPSPSPSPGARSSLRINSAAIPSQAASDPHSARRRVPPVPFWTLRICAGPSQPRMPTAYRTRFAEAIDSQPEAIGLWGCVPTARQIPAKRQMVLVGWTRGMANGSRSFFATPGLPHAL